MAKRKKEIPSYYGKGGRLKKSPSKLLINTAYQHDCDQAEILLPGLHKANLAHAIMLVEAGVIPLKNGKKIIKALLQLEKIKDFPMDPKHGDVYNNVDVVLKAKIKEDAGWIHAGRPRREAVNVAYILASRNALLDVIEKLISLCETTLDVATKHVETIMPDYTYLHHAHPTVLGHYVLTFLFPALRDLERLKAAYIKLNQCNAGSGSVNGSRLPLNRKRLKTLLGFDAVIPHTRDAMWQVDIPMEILNAATICMTNWSRLADEFIIWNTKEFSLIELPDDLCRASVIMPQKKNPYPLTYFRGLTNHLLGKLSSYAALGKVVSGNPDSRIFIYDDLPESLEKISGALELFSSLLAGSTFNRSLMYERASKDYSYTTDLADHFIMKYKIDYRSAHQIMGKVVYEMNQKGLSGNEIRIEHIQEAAHSIGIKTISMSAVQLRKFIAPENIVKSRRSQGGAGKIEMTKLLSMAKKQIQEFKNWHKKSKQKQQTAENQLYKIANSIIK